MSAPAIPGVLGFESICAACNSRQKVRSDGEVFRWPHHQRRTVTGGEVVGLYHWAGPETVVVDECPQGGQKWQPMEMSGSGWIWLELL